METHKEDSREKIIEEVINDLLREGYNIREISKKLKEKEKIDLKVEKKELRQDVFYIPPEIESI